MGLLCVPLEPRISAPPTANPCSPLEDWLGKLGEALLRLFPNASAENCLLAEPGRTLDLRPGQCVKSHPRSCNRFDLLTGSALLNGSGTALVGEHRTRCWASASNDVTDTKCTGLGSAGPELLKPTRSS